MVALIAPTAVGTRRPRPRTGVHLNAPTAVTVDGIERPDNGIERADPGAQRTMTYDRDPRQRRSTRLRGYDYAAPRTYFVTICTRRRQMFFD